MKGFPRESGGRERPAPGGRTVQRPTLWTGVGLREFQDRDGQLATRLPLHGQQPGQLGRVKATSDRIIRDPQTPGNRIRLPTDLASESATYASFRPGTVDGQAWKLSGIADSVPSIRFSAFDLYLACAERLPELPGRSGSVAPCVLRFFLAVLDRAPLVLPSKARTTSQDRWRLDRRARTCSNCTSGDREKAQRGSTRRSSDRCRLVFSLFHSPLKTDYRASSVGDHDQQR